jgi:hypothetical protein
MMHLLILDGMIPQTKHPLYDLSDIFYDMWTQWDITERKLDLHLFPK